MGSCQVAAGLPQAGLVVGARKLQAPQGDRRGNAPTQALEAATFHIRQARHRAVQPQVAPQRAQLVLRGSCVYQRMSPVLPVCVQALNRQPAGFTGELPARPIEAATLSARQARHRAATATGGLPGSSACPVGRLHASAGDSCGSPSVT